MEENQLLFYIICKKTTITIFQFSFFAFTFLIHPLLHFC